jgi:hypothetical protein
VLVGLAGDDDTFDVGVVQCVFEVGRIGDAEGIGVLLSAPGVVVPAGDEFRVVEVFDLVRVGVDVSVREREYADSDLARHGLLQGMWSYASARST